MKLDACIEAILFYKAEPVHKKQLARFLNVTESDIETGITTLIEKLKGRGITLVVTDTQIQLTTSPEESEIIEQLRKDELTADIGKAGAETLAIILYRGPLSRAEVDRIRGVNSAFIIRNLLVRGLVERRSHPTDSRSFVYAITPLLLQHLGVHSPNTLPDFESIMTSLDAFEREIGESEAVSDTHV